MFAKALCVCVRICACRTWGVRCGRKCSILIPQIDWPPLPSRPLYVLSASSRRVWLVWYNGKHFRGAKRWVHGSNARNIYTQRIPEYICTIHSTASHRWPQKTWCQMLRLVSYGSHHRPENSMHARTYKHTHTHTRYSYVQIVHTCKYTRKICAMARMHSLQLRTTLLHNNITCICTYIYIILYEYEYNTARELCSSVWLCRCVHAGC